MQIVRRYWGKVSLIISLVALACLMVLVAFLVPAQGAVLRPAPMQPADPSECIHVNIIDNSGNGPTLHTVFCGFGSEGISPLLTRVATTGPLVVDGGTISPTACTATVPCFVVWPLSPQTGP